MIALAGVIFGCLNMFGNKPISDTEQKKFSQTLNKSFSAKANIKLDQTTLVADINKTAPDAMTLQIAEPDTLKDLCFTYNGSDIVVSYKNMQVSLTDDSLISKGIAGMIMKAVNASTEESGISMHTKDGVLVLTGKTEEGKFTMQVDKKTGSILNLSIPSLDLECEFSNFMFQDTVQGT